MGTFLMLPFSMVQGCILCFRGHQIYPIVAAIRCTGSLF